MTVYLFQLFKISGCVIGLLWISSCGREDASAQVGNEDSVPKHDDSATTKLTTNELKADVTIASDSQRDPNEIKGQMLLDQLGDLLPSGTQQRLDQIGDLPEMQGAAIEPNGKVYALDIKSDGGMVVYLGKDNKLIAFGVASNAAQSLAAEEKQLLSGFELAEEREVTVMDDKFESALMRIQVFRSKALPQKMAVIYSRGSVRTVAFYDSSRVQITKLLPVSPETMDPALLKQLKALK